MGTNSGKHCVVTGGSGDIGLATCRGLLQAGCKVLLTCSSADSAQRATAQLREWVPGSEPVAVAADLSSLADTAALAERIISLQPATDVLILNAGIAVPDYQQSVDGIEQTFAVNHLSQFLLLHKLLPSMTQQPHARVVHVASQIHANGFAGEFQCSPDHYDGMRAYCESKLANILTTFELARRLDVQSEGPVTVNTLHPGVVDSALLSNLQDCSTSNAQRKEASSSLLAAAKRTYWRLRALGKPRPTQSGYDTPEQAAATTLFLALDATVQGVTGQYFKECQAQSPKTAASDPELAASLWNYSEQLVAGYLEPAERLNNTLS